MQVLSPGGIVVGPPHSEGGVPFILSDTGRHIEEEGEEINIPRELAEDDAIYTFRGSNAKVLNQILKLAGLSITDKVTTVKSGDIVICVRSAWDDTIRTFIGTIEEILHKINTSGGCKPIMKPDQPPMKAKNGKVFILRKRDMESENPNSERWQKKKAKIEELSNNIHRLRLNVSRDIQSDDERTALTALVVAVMDRTAERIGNDDSADNGHFGVTGFRKKHISVVGNKVHLDYVGKSGTKHEKSFSDERIAKALKKAIKNAPGKFIFETSDGFRIKSDKVNRYLEPFKISAKDLRGYLANKWIIQKLQAAIGRNQEAGEQPEKAKKERKKIFNKAVKETAAEVGHGSGTLKKHYMIPELPNEYINNGRIIDMKNLGYYQGGGSLEKGIEIEKEHKNLFEEIKKRLAAKGVSMPITEHEFYSEIAKAHIKERKDYYDLIEKYVEKYTNENSNTMKNISERSKKIVEKLWSKQIGLNENERKLLEIFVSEFLEKGYIDPKLILVKNQILYKRLVDKNIVLLKPYSEYQATVELTEVEQNEVANASGEKFQEGGTTYSEPLMEEEITEEEQPDCGCFFFFIKKENPELVEQLIEEDVNSNPEIRRQVDEEYKKWRGGKL